jgi:protein translocase SecG subunit
MSRINILAGIQIFISVLLIFSVLLQQRGSGIGSLFGGPGAGSGGEFYRTRRGAEKFLFYLTIVMAVFLVITSFLFLYIKN